MNINFYYKGQTVSIKTQHQFDLKRVYGCSLPKFNQHFHQELLLFGTNLRFRSRRTNSLLNMSDVVGVVLQDNDMVIIEPNENLTSSSQSIHGPKRYDIATIDNNYIPVSINSTDHTQKKNNVYSKPKIQTKYPHPMDIKNIPHRYQKADIPKVPHNFTNPFERTDLRRSLGADVAPQYDIQNSNASRTGIFSTCDDSDSSVSDFNNITKPAIDKKALRLRNFQSKINDFEKIRSISKSAPASPTKPVPPSRSPHTHVSMLNSYNVRTIGNKINISIIKKPSVGLGFTIVTRDNPVIYGSAAEIANSVVILVNKILPNGGAAEDNSLRPGDRLLEVNGVQVTSLKDATEKLRAIPENERVNLLISRVDRYETPSKEKLSGGSTPQSSIKQITFEILLNQNQMERQQLGLNIRCLDHTENPSMGPGIYIDSILNNSLAAQQGNLKVNDKLIGINGRNINDIDVEETISLLKTVMKNDSVLAITVCRPVTVEQQVNNNESVKKEQNYYLLPNKMSMDKKTQPNIDSHSYTYSSRYSSSDSLSQRNNSAYHQDSTSAFVRESKGRRSMSDKRKAHEDASQYLFYQETRLGDEQISDGDRLYSTLPTASRIKKMANNQSPYLQNKTHIPVKPSQIKQLNTPKNQQDQMNKVPKTPHRSVSLRNSPTQVIQSSLGTPQSPKHFSQTPTHDQPPSFNRAMNNSFKRAVQKSLPDNEKALKNTDSIEPHVPRRESIGIPNPKSAENPYPIYNPRLNNEKIPRSNSVKVPVDKKKSFNLKNFLTFTSNINRAKSIISKEKPDLFPLNQPPRYQQSSGNNNMKHNYSPSELPLKPQQFDDPVIIDSTKRVLEWQMKNEDVISKENKFKEQKVYQTVNPYGTLNYKAATDFNMTARTPVSNRNIFPNNARSGHDTDPYDSVDGTLSIPIGMSKPKSSQPRSNNPNNNTHYVSTSPTNGVNSINNRNTYQVPISRKTSPPSDIYATVNKVSKKEGKSPKQPQTASHSHINKYRF